MNTFRDSLSLITYIILDVLLGGILMELTRDYLDRKADNLQKEISSYLYWLITASFPPKSKPKPKTSTNRHKIKVT